MKFRSSIILLFILSTSCFATSKTIDQTENIINQDNEPYFNIIFGFSPFVGLLGFEYQKGNNAYGIGLPGRISYRYYYKPYQDSKFWGMYLGSFSPDCSNTSKQTCYLDGIDYSHVKRSYIGAGIGYRWQWPSGWNASASIALEYYDKDYFNPATSQEVTDSDLILFPGLNIGYKF